MSEWTQLPIDGMEPMSEAELAAKEDEFYARLDALTEMVDRLTLEVTQLELWAERRAAEAEES